MSTLQERILYQSGLHQGRSAITLTHMGVARPAVVLISRIGSLPRLIVETKHGLLIYKVNGDTLSEEGYQTAPARLEDFRRETAAPKATIEAASGAAA